MAKQHYSHHRFGDLAQRHHIRREVHASKARAFLREFASTSLQRDHHALLSVTSCKTLEKRETPKTGALGYKRQNFQGQLFQCHCDKIARARWSEEAQSRLAFPYGGVGCRARGGIVSTCARSSPRQELCRDFRRS